MANTDQKLRDAWAKATYMVALVDNSKRLLTKRMGDGDLRVTGWAAICHLRDLRWQEQRAKDAVDAVRTLCGSSSAYTDCLQWCTRADQALSHVVASLVHIAQDREPHEYAKFLIESQSLAK